MGLAIWEKALAAVGVVFMWLVLLAVFAVGMRDRLPSAAVATAEADLPAPPAPAAAEQRPPPTPAERLTSYLADRYKRDPERMKSAELRQSRTSGLQATILVKGLDNLTVGMTRDGALTEAMEIIKELSTLEEMRPVDLYDVGIYLSLTDVYQHSSDQLVMRTKLSSTDARQANWSGIYAKQFERLLLAAGSLYVHPALGDREW